MKNHNLLSVLLIATAPGFFGSAAFGQANTTLSNLAATTAVNSPLLPQTNNTKNLGSTDKSWMNTYVDGTIFIGDAPFLKKIGSGNNLIGGNAGYAITTGTYNTFSGDNTGRYTTSGYSNSFFGQDAGFTNTVGILNTFVGKAAGYLNNGDFNTAVGASAMLKNYLGSNNSAFGFNALGSNEWGDFNTAIGSNSLNSNLDGSENTAVGGYALYANTTGIGNTAIGDKSLYSNTISNYNTAAGFNALSAITGDDNDNNTALGLDALSLSESANNCVAIGCGALSNTGVSYNTAVGGYALHENYWVVEAPCFGATCIGFETNNTYWGYNNITAIGYLAQSHDDEGVHIGNASITSNGGQVSWTAYSDGRIKTTIQENVPGLEFINALRPVTYHFDISKQNELTSLIDTAQWEGKYDIEKMQWTGFIAQEVEAAADKIEYDFSGIDKSGEIMGLRYEEFVVPLVQAVQELSARKSVLQATNANLVERITNLEALLSATNTSTTTDINAQSVK